jgi:hypothetical protein
VQAGGRTQRRLADPAYGYCSASDARVHVGLGAAERADQVRVRWPDGALQDFGPLAAGAVHRLDQAKIR